MATSPTKQGCDLKPEIGQRISRPVLQASLDHRRPRSSIDDHRDPDNLGTVLEQRIDGRENGRSSGRCVLDSQHSPTGDTRAFDPSLQAMLLLGLANNEGIKSLSIFSSGMQHGSGHWISPEGQSSNGIEGPVRRELAHHISYERGGNRVEGDPSQIDVVVGLPATGQDHFAVDYGLVDDLLTKFIPCDTGHGSTLGCDAW